MKKPAVRKLIELIPLRNSHPSFAGTARIETPCDQNLMITWTKDGHWTKLDVDFARPHAVVIYSKEGSADYQAGGRWESQEDFTSAKAI